MKRFVVIGLGGIGSHIIDPLARFLNYSMEDECALTLVDADEFSRSNMTRQVCSLSDVGTPKVNVVAERISKICPRLQVVAAPFYIQESNIADFIRQGSTVFMCVDNHATRKIVTEFCDTLKNVTLISGGNEFSDGNAHIFIRRNNERLTARLDEYHPEIAEPNDVNPADEVEHHASCEEEAVGTPQLIFANFFAAASMLGLFYHQMKVSETEEEAIPVVGEIYFDLEKAAVGAFERPSIEGMAPIF